MPAPFAFEPGGGGGLGGGNPPSPPPPPPPSPPSPPSPPPPEPPGDAVLVTAPDSLQNAINAHGNGKAFILRGTFANQGPSGGALAVPKPGNEFYAHDTGAVLDGTNTRWWGINGKDKTDLVVVGLEVKGFIDVGIRLGQDHYVGYVHAHHCTGTGLGGGMGFDDPSMAPDAGPGGVVEFCHVHDCGSVEALGHDAGGIKFANVGTSGNPSIVRNCDIHDNIGNGLWWDRGAAHCIAEDNLIQRNGRKGLFQEKGYGTCYFRRNKVYKNGWLGTATDSTRYGNILNASSKNCHFHDNITWDATNSVGLSWFDRDDAPPSWTANGGSESAWDITGCTSRRNKLYGGDQREFRNDTGSPNPQTSGGVVFGTGADADQFFAGDPP